MKIWQHTKLNIGSRNVRRGIQLLLLIIVCFIGFRFSQFASALERGMIPLVDRPAGVEAFLPISALVSLKYFIFTGIINEIHPSGLVLFFIICTTAFIVRKGFCSWICPFGLLSEYFLKLHYMIFKKGVTLPFWPDCYCVPGNIFFPHFSSGLFFLKCLLRP